MNCVEAEALISAELDSAIQPSERAALDAHLGACAPCRATADAFRLQDAELRRAFAARREAAAATAERVGAQLRAGGGRPARRPLWLPMLLSAAAGFLLAVGVFRPWRSARTPATHSAANPAALPRRSRELVRLAVATAAAVESLAPGELAWRRLEHGQTIEVGSRVRTGPKARCEFHTADGSEIRLNGGTELLFRTGRGLDLARGQILASVVEAAEPFEVEIPAAEATVSALGTQFDILCRPADSDLTVLQGSTRVQGKGDGEIVKTGETARIAHGRVAAKRRVENLAKATRWVHEILILKGRKDPELARRVDDLLAQIGQTKMAELDEEDIRALGDHCVLPLTRYIQSGRSRSGPELIQRVQAARILSDLAQPWSIPDLIELLRDDNPDVRFFTAKALTRLTGQSFGVQPEAWRDRPAAALRAAAAQWREWWQQNKDRFPEMPEDG